MKNNNNLGHSVADHPIAKSAKFFHAHSPSAQRTCRIKRAVIGTFAVAGMLSIFGMPGKGATPGWVVQGCGDFNGDGKTDVFWYNSNTGETSAWMMNGDRVSQNPKYLVVAP